MKHLVALACLALAGCVTVTESNVSTLGMMDLCAARIVAMNLGDSGGASMALAEIQKRGGFSANELRAIERNQVFVGMSEAAGLCSWGNAFDAVNTTATAGGTTKQYVYSGSEFSKARYLYTSGGRVTAFQM